MAPIEPGPFYAVKVVPGSFGTFAGLRTDASARVLGAAGAPIPGLYAAGTDMASVMGGHYPAGGINLGPAMTFGYIAGRHAAGAEGYETGTRRRERPRNEPGVFAGASHRARARAAGDGAGRRPHRLPDRGAAADRRHRQHARLPADGRPGDAARYPGCAGGDRASGVLDIEFVRITPELAPASLEPFLAAGAELGARQVITAPYDPDLGRLADRLGALTDLAAGYGLGAVLEFFPWTSVPDLATAVRVVAAAGPRTGILVDTLHFDRSGSALADLDGVPASRLPFVHLCDAPVQPPYTTEELLHAGRAERLPPGEGGIDIRGILRRMPAGHPAGAGGADDGDDRGRGCRGGGAAGARGGGAAAGLIGARRLPQLKPGRCPARPD